ncbi:MAG: hypothetical protein WBE34_04850 [Candidatus Nitrosopolaris sp.]
MSICTTVQTLCRLPPGSMMFGITHYNPAGGSMTLKVPQYSKSQAISIMMDGKLYKEATEWKDNITRLFRTTR